MQGQLTVAEKLANWPRQDMTPREQLQQHMISTKQPQQTHSRSPDIALDTSRAEAKMLKAKAKAKADDKGKGNSKGKGKGNKGTGKAKGKAKASAMRRPAAASKLSNKAAKVKQRSRIPMLQRTQCYRMNRKPLKVDISHVTPSRQVLHLSTDSSQEFLFEK